MSTAPRVSRIGDFSLVWGESLRWDERRQRLYFVDCASQTLHWLDDGEPPLRSLPMPSLATGLALTEDGRIVAALGALGGTPDGACADGDGGVWSCVLAAGKLARFTAAGLDRTVDTGVELPSDVTFGGPDLDRLFFVSIAVSLGDIEITSPHAGALMVVDGTGLRGRPEPRFRL